MGSPSPDDLAFDAGRVELYRCPACHHTTRFPRYNDPGTDRGMVVHHGYSNHEKCILYYTPEVIHYGSHSALLSRSLPII